MNTYTMQFIEDESNYTYVQKGISLYIYIYIYIYKEVSTLNLLLSSSLLMLVVLCCNLFFFLFLNFFKNFRAVDLPYTDLSELIKIYLGGALTPPVTSSKNYYYQVYKYCGLEPFYVTMFVTVGMHGWCVLLEIR